jgi:hypothetical protein
MRMTVEPTIVAPTTDEVTARREASAYIHPKLGAAYQIEPGFFCDRAPRPAWRFLILHREHNAVAGHVDVDAATGKVIPLDDEQMQDMHERAAVIGAKSRKTLARDEKGYVLPFLAKVRVNGYLACHVAFFARAKGQPTFVNGNSPVWRVATALRLDEPDTMVELGVVDVDARTGDVIPLTVQQIQNMQRCAADVAATLQRSATPAG